MRELVREEAERGTTVFFSSHILGQVEAVCDRVGILSEGELVAVDTVEDLRKTVGAGSEIRLHLTDEAGVDSDRLAADLGGVDSARLTDGLLRVECANSSAKARVVTRLTNDGVDILDIDSEEVSLEEVFTAYTRDGGVLEGDERDGSEDDADEPAEIESVSGVSG
jgi:ABC-2 type transport system ATP-binding protein